MEMLQSGAAFNVDRLREEPERRDPYLPDTGAFPETASWPSVRMDEIVAVEEGFEPSIEL